MSALDGFYSTWNKARETFGVGTPVDGSGHDGSSQLMRMKGMIESAAPDHRWQGSGSQAYAAANKEHAGVYEKLAALDKKMAAEVTNAANIVTSGRQNLDRTREWVASLAASMPDNNAAKGIMLAVTSKGIEQVSSTIQQSTEAMTEVGRRVTGLKGEWEALLNQKFGPGSDKPEGKNDSDATDDQEARERAEEDVRKALAGDREAARRIDNVLESLDAAQRSGTKDLSPEQGSYLSQMNAQTHGMSPKELAIAEGRLGDYKRIMGDSWQLMSNDDIRFPKTETTVGALDDPTQTVKGGFDQLPQSVQDAISNKSSYGTGSDMMQAANLDAISSIVHDGQPKYQTGTELDREMIRAADRLMDFPDINSTSTVQGIFEASGRDHQIVHDHILGTHGDNGDDFLHDVNNTRWRDDGTAAGSLFSWTHDNHLESGIADATASKYAEYLGSHKDDLMRMSNPSNPFGHVTLGQLNPELVKAYAHGLTPYMDDIAGITGANTDGDGFKSLDGLNSERPIAKGLFSVLGTQQDAYVEFNAAADKLALEQAHSYANDVGQHADVRKDDPRMLNAAVLQGLVDSGTHEGLRAIGMSEKDAYDMRKLAYGAGVTALSTAVGASPAGPAGGAAMSVFGSAMESTILGDPPNTNMPAIPDMTGDRSARFVLNSLLAQGVDVDLSGIDENFIRQDGVNQQGQPVYKILSYQEMSELGLQLPADTDFQGQFNQTLENTLGADRNPAGEYARKYEQITKIPDAKKDN
ncbi:TPR repeat region-containing protein [[Mycobacterium] fortunisiensis]|uniref:TPR repeat region-containing protein n=1 Tax=[Mycobacterium] fortunisiensis TaxID=2600579 RepID=UPI001C267679|nr:EspA/EspE family type VII secretion system effector [[Mycobacterium] fortunisiensis]